MSSPKAPVPATHAVRRVGFVMEQVLGHVTHYRTLRQILEREPGIMAHWVEVTYEDHGRLERVRALPASARGTLRGWLQARRGLRGIPVHALFFHTHKPAVFHWDLLTRIPTVLSLDVTPAQYDALGRFYDHTPDGGTGLAHFKWWVNRRTFGLARLVVAWSTWVKASLVSQYGVPAEKIRVIPPGVDLDLWTRPFDAGRGSDRPRLLFVGGDFHRKGGRLLLEWFRQHGRGRCELDLVTRAPIPPEPGVRVHRDIVGNSPQARELYLQADLFVLPSLGECFGIAFVEAMAAGLPVIASRVGGTQDIVDDGQTGLLIEPNDQRALSAALNKMLIDAVQRRIMGQRGRAKAERAFSAVTNARALVACLEEAAASRPPLKRAVRQTAV
jgi:glycosyltransferase involved in cell wall biosynthesis